MKRKLFFNLIIIAIVTLQSLLLLLTNKQVSYQLKIDVPNNYSNKYLLAPKSIDFRPINTNQLIEKYTKTKYNFYYYIDPNYLVITNTEVCLRILESITS